MSTLVTEVSATNAGTETARQRGFRLPPAVAFGLLVSILLFFLAGSSAPTPLYAVYQAEWGFSPITVTVVFGVYALAVLAALLTFGSLSDHVGRRPILIVAVLVQAATMVVFAEADGVPELLAARIVQGLATGSAMGAIGAGLLDIDKRRGTIANGVGALMGTASGALAAGLLVQYLPSPTHLVYYLLGTIFLVQAVGVALMPETSTRKAGALASLRLQIGLPASARRPMLLAIPALVAVWSLAGFYGSLGPALVRLIAGSDSFVLGGAALFVLAAGGALAVYLSRDAAPRTVMLLGTVGLFGGVAITLLAMAVSSTVIFFVGAVVAGLGFGGGFQGALRTVVPLAAPHERAGVLSTLYVVSYLAMGVPAVAGGVLAVDSGVLTAAREYGLAVMVLAAVALLGMAVPTSRRAPARHLAGPPVNREPGRPATTRQQAAWCRDT